MKKLLKILDKLFCIYIGIDKQEITPATLILAHNQLTIVNTESFKRHTYCSPIHTFFESSISEVSEINQKKLSMAIGKCLAKNLIVSFEHFNLQSDVK